MKKLFGLMMVGSLLAMACLSGCGDTTASGGSCTTVTTIENNQPTDSNNTTTLNPPAVSPAK